MDDLRGKVAVVTGAASGIGLAVAQQAAAEGMKVVLADIEAPALAQAEAALAATGASVLAVVTDVAVADSVDALAATAIDSFGALHLVHNNAGVAVGGPLWTVPYTDWSWVLGVNLWGVIHGIRTFVPLLVDQGEGHVVNTASVAGLLSPTSLGPYNATKHAVVAISETLAMDLQAAGSSVGVSVLCPGFVHTAIADSGRNRPPWAPAPPEHADPGPAPDLTRQLIAGGLAPSVVARRVLDAVRTNEFYILTHPEVAEAVRARMNGILEGRRPTLPFAPTVDDLA